jgi:glycosyltransferase involved in cell wall biosynthesis
MQSKNRIEVLVSTMNLISPAKLIQSMRISGFYTIINQITDNSNKRAPIRSKNGSSYDYVERGLSRSRNRAIENSKGDILVLADDDMYYAENYLDLIESAYKKYTDADIIAFHVNNEDTGRIKERLKEGRLGYVGSMKLSSWQITFRKTPVTKSGVSFDQNFGTGTEMYMGEENIFLFDCLKAGLKIYYVGDEIATLKLDSISTWFKGYDDKFFRVRGATYKRMSKLWHMLLIIQFAVRKKYLYKETASLLDAIKYMIQGARS